MKVIDVIALLIVTTTLVFGFQTPLSQRLMSTTFATTTSDAVTIGGKTVTAKLLKSFTLTNTDGGKTRIGDLTGQDKSVVVFLRHLG
jgi:hypothetical protein